MTFFVCVDATGHPSVARAPTFDVVGTFDDMDSANSLVQSIKDAREANAPQDPATTH